MKQVLKLVLKMALLLAVNATMLPSVAGVLPTNTHTGQAPNIILMLADDMNWFDIGAYHSHFDYTPGNAITPHIDKLAAEGMLFTRSFSATAMCAPTRMQLYTGLYPVRNGAYGNHTRVYDEVKSVAHYFKDLGYRVGIAGKGHIFPHRNFPFERVGKENKGSEGETSFGLTALTKNTVSQFMARDLSQPFFLVVASSNPHTPWNRGNSQQYPPQQLTLPTGLPDSAIIREKLSRYLAEVSDLDRELGLLEREIESLDIKDNTIMLFTSEQGSSFPFAKWTNYDSDLRNALIIRWPNTITAGVTNDAMIEHIDVLPTLTDLVNGTIPTGLDGKSFKHVLRGDSQQHKNYVYGLQTSSNIHNGSPYPIRSVRSDRYKLIHNLMPNNRFSNILTNAPWFKAALLAEQANNGSRYAGYITRPEYELYDLHSDPFEQHNLYQQTTYQPTFKHLRQKLSAWMQQQGDRGIETELRVCERKGFIHKGCNRATTMSEPQTEN